MKRLTPFVLLCALSTACSGPGLSLVPRVGFYELSGDFAATEGATAVSSSIDDLGLSDSEAAFAPRVEAHVGGMMLDVSAFSTEFSGRGTVQGDITIDDITITQGTDVDTDFGLDSADASLTWDLIPTDMAELAIGLGVNLMQLDITLDEVNTTQTLETDELLPIPHASARASVHFGPATVGASVAFFDYSDSEMDVSFLDVEATAQWKLIGGDQRLSGRLVGGYRLLDLDAEYDDGDSQVVADFRLDGPFIGLSFSF